MMRAFLFTLITSFFLSIPAISTAGDPTVTFSKNDPAMNRAIENAVDTLDLFLKTLDIGNGEIHPNGSLKVSFEVSAPPK